MFSKHSLAVFAIAAGLAAPAAGARQPPKPAPTIGPDTRICVVEPPVTGSFLPTKTCKTAGEWRKDGVDPARLLAARK